MNDFRKSGLARIFTFIAALGDSDSLFLRPDGSVAFDPEFESWLGILPSFGVGWKL